MNMKKCLTTIIILLLFGVSIAPSINASISQNNEMVELTTEICGLKGEKYTVKLTSEESEKLERLINSIKEQLDEVETIWEVEEIFKKGVVELDRFGLFGDLSVKQVQRLVTKSILYPKSIELIEKLSNGKDAIWNGDSNNFCLISGKTTYTMFLGMLSAGIRIYSPIGIMNTMMFGRIEEVYYYGTYFNYYPSRGWVYTLGQKGMQSWNGTFWGELNMFSLYTVYSSIFWALIGLVFGRTPFASRYYGVMGFSGIKVLFDDYSYFYLGFALRVGLTYETPEHP